MSSIRVDHRDRRSALTAVVQIILRPIGGALIKLNGEYAAGSPKLTPHPSVAKKCPFRERSVQDIWIYTGSKPHTASSGSEAVAADGKKAKKAGSIYYFAGGGFRNAPEREHWAFVADLCLNLPEYETSMVSYPLAPNNPAPKAIPLLVTFLRALEQEAIQNDCPIVLMGDSAGANIALILGLNAAAEHLSRVDISSPAACPVRSVMAICPPTDMRNTNSEIDVRARKDPLLSRKIITGVAETWRGDWDASDPRLSPLLADLSILAQAKIKVDGIIGEYDVLGPDARLFRQKLASSGVDGDWLEWDKQVHAFPLMFSYHIPEGRESVRWMREVLRKNLSTERTELVSKA